MRVLFLNSIGRKKWGGGEKWMLMAAAGLAARGHEVLIGCAPGSIIRENAQKKGLSPVHVHFKSDFDLPGFLRLSRVLRRRQITHVVCGQNKDTKIAAVAAMLVPGVRVLARHGLQLIAKKWKYKFIFTRCIHGIFTNSETIRKAYESYGWFPDGFVQVIHNGFTPPDAVEAFDFRAKFGLEKDSLVLFSAGRLARQKGFDVMIEAAVQAREAGYNWRFFVAGTGKLERELQQLVQQKQLEKHFIFLGFVEDVLPYVKGADVFVLSSFYEGMPNAVMEAMGLGKCCVVTAVNGSTELINSGDNGVLVKPGSAGALFEGLQQVAENATLRSRMGQAALATVEASFSEARMLDRLEAFLSTRFEIN